MVSGGGSAVARFLKWRYSLGLLARPTNKYELCCERLEGAIVLKC